MLWIKNNLIDDKNKYLVGYDAGGDCCDWAEVKVLDENGNDITEKDLTDWEFTEFPELDAMRAEASDEIPIANKKLNLKGKVVCECSNNGYYSANYWTKEHKKC